MAENKMEQVESLLKWLASGEKDEDGNWLDDDDTQLVCDALEYYLNIHGQKNKMAEVAKLFGKTLGEEFRIRDSNLVYVFDDVGLAEYGVVYNNEMLRKLLTGEAEIVEK